MPFAIPRSRFWLYAAFLTAGMGVLGYQHFSRLAEQALAASAVLSSSESADGTGHLEIISSAYTIDRMYQSMEGPASNQSELKLSPDTADEAVLFITGVSSQVVDPENRAGRSTEFFCHANLTLNPATSSPDKHNASFEQPTHMDWRLATLVPVMSLQLPPGFGVPVKNGTRLDYYTMALNQNPGVPSQQIRIKSRLDYTHAAATRALFRRSAYVHQQFRDTLGAPADITMPTGHAGAACGQTCNRDQRGKDPSLFVDLTPIQSTASPAVHPGATCCVSNASVDGVMTQFGTDSTIHWMVPPGRHSYKTDVSAQMELPFDTTAHLITGHLHPYGTSMRLVDKQSGKVVFEITSRDFSDKIGVQHMSEIMSTQGVALRKDGQFELVAEYENTTEHPIDAMAIMYFYLAESPDQTLLAAKN